MGNAGQDVISYPLLEKKETFFISHKLYP